MCAAHCGGYFHQNFYMLRSLFITILTCSFACSHAQHQLYLRGDFGASNVKANGSKGNGDFAFGLGVETFFGIGKHDVESQVGLNPNLSYLGTGYETTVGGKVRVNYLSLAMPIIWSINGYGTNKEVGLIGGIGPFVNYAVGGKFRNLSTEAYRKMSFGDGKADNRRSSDAGLAIKGGLRAGAAYLGMQYNFGLANVIPKDRVTNDAYLHTRNFLFYLSVPLTPLKRGK